MDHLITFRLSNLKLFQLASKTEQTECQNHKIIGIQNISLTTAPWKTVSAVIHLLKNYKISREIGRDGKKLDALAGCRETLKETETHW